jgi:ArsR family transcriptional regulator
MRAAARARLGSQGNVEVKHGTLESLPLPAASVDAALVGLVLHHVSDPGAVIVEAARVLKPGGRLLITDMLPHDRDEYRQQMGHVWLGFSEKQMARYLSAAGFVDMRLTPLPQDARAKGPTLFAATARRHTKSAGSKSTGSTDKIADSTNADIDRVESLKGA